MARATSRAPAEFRADTCRRLFEADGAKARFFRHDVEAVASHAGLVADVKAAFCRLDLFVSNAGIGAPGGVTCWRLRRRASTS